MLQAERKNWSPAPVTDLRASVPPDMLPRDLPYGRVIIVEKPLVEPCGGIEDGGALDEDNDVEGRDLVRRLRGGDQDALAEAFEHWGAMVHTIAFRSMLNHHDAEDITQQVFVSAWRSRESLRDDAGSLGGWLASITKRRCADVYRSRARDRRNEAAIADFVEGTVPGHADRVTEQVLVAQELAAMGDPRATVIRLAIIEDRPYEDIARTLDMPMGTVKSHVRRGLGFLRNRLEGVNV